MSIVLYTNVREEYLSREGEGGGGVPEFIDMLLMLLSLLTSPMKQNSQVPY